MSCGNEAGPTLQPSRPATEVRICREPAGLTDSEGGPPPFLPGVCAETIRPPAINTAVHNPIFIASPLHLFTSSYLLLIFTSPAQMLSHGSPRGRRPKINRPVRLLRTEPPVQFAGVICRCNSRYSPILLEAN